MIEVGLDEVLEVQIIRTMGIVQHKSALQILGWRVSWRIDRRLGRRVRRRRLSGGEGRLGADLARGRKFLARGVDSSHRVEVLDIVGQTLVTVIWRRNQPASIDRISQFHRRSRARGRRYIQQDRVQCCGSKSNPPWHHQQQQSNRLAQRARLSPPLPQPSDSSRAVS